MPEPVMTEQPTPAKVTSVNGGHAFDMAHLCRNFSELSPQPMVAVEGTTHKVRYVNDAFVRLVGKEKTELIGRPFAEAVPEGEENACLSLLDRVYRTGEPEILAEQPHGQASPLHWTYSVWAILGADERPVGIMIQVTDSTETATFRKQVVAMNGQLLLSAARQHELTEVAEKANRIKDEFLAMVSHELRTPVSVIVGWTDLLGDSRIGSEDFTHAIEIIKRNAWIQVQMIDDLLDVGRIMTGKLRLTVQSVDLASIVSAAIESLKPGADAKSISLKLELDSPSAPISGDPDRLQQMASNLLSNAIKFTRAGGRVAVKLSHVGELIELTVSDTGRGIEAESLPHIFDRFRQADSTSTRAFGGLGLGLAIVRELAELHGGSVRAYSAGEDLGATFTLSLPALARTVEGTLEQSPQLELTSPESACPSILNGLRVLVIDDEDDTCQLVQFILESCGANVRTATCAREALEAVANDDFDVLLSDIALPDDDDYSLLAKVRALSSKRGGKVPLAAALTVYTSEEDRVHALQSGFQMHISKPISPNELIALVADLASQAEQAM